NQDDPEVKHAGDVRDEMKSEPELYQYDTKLGLSKGSRSSFVRIDEVNLTSLCIN
ncbi:hypothetical protein Ancab_006211, partial [Ancistrocladus abbreviatus]